MNLTPAQLEAVESTADETLVLAGAGSGKTRVLVHRIAHLLNHCGRSASDLLVLTFTRKAAGEMIDRLAILLGDERELRGMLIGTFHSVALQILRADGDKLGYDAHKLTILDPDDAHLLLMQAARYLGFYNGKSWKAGLSKKTLTTAIDRFYTSGSAPPSGNNETDEAIHHVALHYWTSMRNMNSLDFGQILSECNRLLCIHDDVLARWQGRIKDVIVDEVQDTDEVQYQLHKFFSPPATFFAVGDRRQCIYRFRGARPDLMEGQRPNARIIDLKDCFRCGHQIVKAANRLIAHNGDKLAKPMDWASGIEGNVERMSGRSADLANHLMDMVMGFGYQFRDIAVLARNHRILERLSAVLSENRIPNHHVGSGFDVCKTPIFKAVHAALRLRVNERDDMAVLRLMTFSGVTQERMAHVRAYAAETGWSLHFASVILVEALPTPYPLVAFSVIVGDFNPVSKALDELRDIFNDETPDRFDEVEAFWLTNCGDMTIETALRWYALRDSQDDHTDQDAVTLCTVHAAKGLEWPVVILADLMEGTLPSSQALREEGGEEDERRVAYVAMTRAKELLVLHVRRPEDQNPDWGVKHPSRFLLEAMEGQTAQTAKAVGDE